MQSAFLLHDTGDTEVAQHNLLVGSIAEEVVAWLDILMDNIIVVTVCQRSSTLQCYTSELVEVAIEVVVCQRTATQILHEFIVAVLTLHIGLAKVGNLDDHLQIETLDDAHQALLDGEVGVINFQHTLTLVTFHQEHLCLTGIVTQALDAAIHSAFQDEVAVTEIIIAVVLHLGTWSDSDVRGTCLCGLWGSYSYRCFCIDGA